jgi:SHS2 domain-containing protein
VCFFFSFLILFSQKIDSEEKGYEYLDHTADVQLHSWAPTLKEAFELVCVAMFGYITELDKVDEDESMEVNVEASGHDMDSLLYSLMDEFLFQVFENTKPMAKIDVLLLVLH